MEEKELSLMEKWAMEHGFEKVEKTDNESNLPVSLMRVEIVCRKIRNEYDKGKIFAILDEYFPDCNKAEGLEIVRVIKKSHKKMEKPLLDDTDLELLVNWANQRPQKIVKDFKFKFEGDFAKEVYRPYLDAGVKCGYLNKDYSRKDGVSKSEFFYFVEFLADIYCYGCIKEAGYFWYGDTEALTNCRIRDNEQKCKKVQELKKALNDKKVCKKKSPKGEST